MLATFVNQKRFFAHKEKLSQHLSRLKLYIENLRWIEKANKISIPKKKLTETEKLLSSRYFNARYVELFNNECNMLNGQFGVSIDHTGSSGKSYKQLKLKGRNPNTVLSEGEQKVLALSDFLAEIQMSEINRGAIFDDPVNSLDESRKKIIAERLVKESKERQIIIFTHDLVFVSALDSYRLDYNVKADCHWIERAGNKPGVVWLNNTPSYEKKYKTSSIAQEYYKKAKSADPEQRDFYIKNGFAALRTSYESLVVFELFNGVVQRFTERISIDSLNKVCFSRELLEKIIDSFSCCCRYMEGHLHSDKYCYIKPNDKNLFDEITRFNELKNSISSMKPKK